MDNLTDEQNAALGQLRDLTNGGDDEVAVGVLDSVGWDVQRAAELIFDGAAPVAGPSRRTPEIREEPRRIETFDVDDSMQGSEPSNYQPVARPSPILSMLAYPFTLLTSVIRFILTNILHIPPTRLSFTGMTFTNLNFSRLWPFSSTPPSGSGGPDKWVRELEEETGALCLSRVRANGVSSGVEAGSSTDGIRARGRGADGSSQKILPDFTLTSYEEMLRMCVNEARIGCVILVSEEHDDVAEFKRSTLTDPTFVNLLDSNNVIVWGGDVRDREPWSASQKLQATTYPFVAFFALQPRRQPSSRLSNSSTATATLTVLSRHQGSPSTVTSAEALSKHLSDSVVPRVSSFLLAQRLHNEEEATRTMLARESMGAERRLRQEQDEAYAMSAAKDRARIEAKMREEQEARRRQQEFERNLEIQEQMKENRESWRHWEQDHFSKDLPAQQSGEKPLRIVLRMPGVDGQMWMLSTATPLTALYARVDALLLPPSSSSSPGSSSIPSSSDPVSTLDSHIASLGPGSAEWWPFTIHLSYPRVPVPYRRGVKLGEVEELSMGGGGALVVEMSGGSARQSLDGSARRSLDNEGGDEDDEGYDSEE